MNTSRRGFLARALGMAVAAPAVEKLIAGHFGKGGSKTELVPRFAEDGRPNGFLKIEKLQEARFHICTTSLPTVTANVCGVGEDGEKYWVGRDSFFFPTQPDRFNEFTPIWDKKQS